MKYYQWRILCQLAEGAETGNQIEKARKTEKRVLFHQRNAPAHKSVVEIAAVRNCSFELVDHPPYSLYLAPSDFFLFPNIKKHLACK